MLSLVYKDWLLQRGSKSFVYMFVMPVLGAFGLPSGILFGILPCLAGSYLYLVYANALDDKYETEKAFLAMPVSRGTIVKTKYIGIGMYLLGSLIFIALLSLVIGLTVPGRGIVTQVSVSTVIQFLLVYSFYYGIMLPVYFKVGYQRSRWMNYVALLLSAGLFAFLIKGVGTLYDVEVPSLQSAFQTMTGISALVWSVIFFVLSGIVIYVSVALSIKYYRAREF